MQFAAALALLFGFAPPAMAAGQCPSPPAGPSFTVDVRDSPVAYRLAAAETLLAQAKTNGTPLGRGRGVLGLTVNRYDLRIRVAVDSAGAEGGYCAQLRSATITVGAQPEVMVDGRFAPGTCQQTAILDHENEHVAVFRDAIGRAAAAIAAAVRGGALPPSLRVATQSEAEEVYARAIRAALDPVMDAARRDAQEANGRLDTPAHYAEVFRRCADW